MVDGFTIIMSVVDGFTVILSVVDGFTVILSVVDPYSRPVEDSVRRPVTYTHKHLKPEADYCVGVNVAARIGRWRPDMWRCVKATTGSE